MAGSTDFRDEALARGEGASLSSPMSNWWPRIKVVLERSAFWAYERGTWQYDIILLVILAFIFLTPLRWYRHPPKLETSTIWQEQSFVEVGRGKDGWRYLIGARLVNCAPPQPCDDIVREALRRRLNGPFKVKSIDAIRDRNNAFVGYAVLVDK